MVHGLVHSHRSPEAGVLWGEALCDILPGFPAIDVEMDDEFQKEQNNQPGQRCSEQGKDDH